MASLLSDDELAALENEHRATGVSARQVIALFQRRGVRLSEGTFRKYVQAGLLPRSRRVGRKGKHQGSVGVYPTNVFRLLHALAADVSGHGGRRLRRPRPSRPAGPCGTARGRSTW